MIISGEPLLKVAPSGVVEWAVNRGRIPAADADLWLARLAGDGGDAYALQLLFGTIEAANRTIPPFST